MDSVPRSSLTSADAVSAATAGGPQSPGQDLPGDPGDDPDSPGHLALPTLLGSVIALVTLTLPLATVLGARQPVPLIPLSYGSEPAAGLPSARSGQQHAGESGRQPP